MQALAQAEPTGATLGWVATPTLPARMVDRGADDLLRRITLLGAVQKEPIAIVSPAATPLGSVQDIVARAADDAEAVPLGTPPPGSPPHLAALRLQALAGTRLNIVAFPSAAAARQAAVAAATSPRPRSACRARSATCARGGWSVSASPPPTAPTRSPICRRCATPGWTCPR